MRRLAAPLAALALLALATPGDAHVPATIRVAEPAEDARVVGNRLRVVIVGEGGMSPATFGMDLDGRPVDATGRIGGVFTSLAVRPGAQLTMRIDVTPGEHTLTITPDPDPDSQQPVQTRRFRVVADSRGSAAPLALAGVAVLVAVGAGVAVRRRAAAAGDGTAAS